MQQIAYRECPLTQDEYEAVLVNVNRQARSDVEFYLTSDFSLDEMAGVAIAVAMTVELGEVRMVDDRALGLSYINTLLLNIPEGRVQ